MLLNFSEGGLGPSFSSVSQDESTREKSEAARVRE
jgi:hypothetical protein